jgi:hypothetical protein
MLAEIFMLRMEAISRASKETAPADNSRFVPIDGFNAELPLEDECSKPRGRPLLRFDPGRWHGH